MHSSDNRVTQGEIGKYLELDTGVDPNDALLDSAPVGGRIYYKKPNGTSAYWVANVIIGDSGNYELTYVSVSGDLDTKGVWILHTALLFSNSRIVYGAPVAMKVWALFERE